MARRLAFLGPRGTFTEEAALRYDSQAELIPCPTISAVAAAVDSREADEGVVPIENSLEGSVNETLDVLVHDSQLHVRAELVLRIAHQLLVKPGTSAQEIEVVFSHPQALAQCRRFIEANLAQAEPVAALSTAAAVEEMLQRTGAAAIGNARAAAIYGADILFDDIQDRKENFTRFVVLAPQDGLPTGADKTSLAFTFAFEDRPGQLVSALDEFASRGINLTKIESRPGGDRLGVYVFLADVDGHHTDSLLSEALAAVNAKCSFFRLMGSYPRYKASG